MLFNILFTFVTHTGAAYSRVVIFLTAGIHLVIGYLSKVLYKKIRHSQHSIRSLFVITTSDHVEEAVSNITDEITNTIHISGIAIVDRNMVGEKVNGFPIVADRENVIHYLTREWVDEVFLRIPRNSPDLDYLFSALMEMGITVHVDIGMLSAATYQKQEVERIGKSLVLTTAINTITGWNAIAKRILDIFGGIIGSILALLVMLIVAIPIKKASPGPLLYTSDRIGLNGKRFKMYKIRSMQLNADAMKEELLSQNRIKDGMMFKLEWDPRIIGNRILPDGTRKTGIGEFIRKTSLDEVPQFFNLVKGDMSLIGPRPLVVGELSDHDGLTLYNRVKPGITGWWACNGRSNINYRERLELEYYYVKNCSLYLDLVCIVRTVLAVIRKEGAQ